MTLSSIAIKPFKIERKTCLSTFGCHLFSCIRPNIIFFNLVLLNDSHCHSLRIGLSNSVSETWFLGRDIIMSLANSLYVFLLKTRIFLLTHLVTFALIWKKYASLIEEVEDTLHNKYFYNSYSKYISFNFTNEALQLTYR